MVKSLIFIRSSNALPETQKIFIPFFVIFVIEIFPLKTTGSFFTSITGNFLFIILAFIVGLTELKKIRNDYEKK